MCVCVVGGTLACVCVVGGTLVCVCVVFCLFILWVVLEFGNAAIGKMLYI